MQTADILQWLTRLPKLETMNTQIPLKNKITQTLGVALLLCLQQQDNHETNKPSSFHLRNKNYHINRNDSKLHSFMNIGEKNNGDGE